MGLRCYEYKVKIEIKKYKEIMVGEEGIEHEKSKEGRWILILRTLRQVRRV